MDGERADDMDAGSPFNPRCYLRMLGNMSDNLADASFDRRCHGLAVWLAGGGYLEEIGQYSVGVFDLHARRKVANAVSTCASLATPLRSASSMACSSSGVA